ncbi:MAG: PD40 domain-containing protein [Candidatus Coatesbacteria bacterium]|nr:PD40 domain-containing protein [Candidatus Coatesbacteria bacterium]
MGHKHSFGQRLTQQVSLFHLLLVFALLTVVVATANAELNLREGGIHLTISATGVRLIEVCLAGPIENAGAPSVEKTREILEFDLSQSSRFKLIKAEKSHLRIIRSKNPAIFSRAKSVSKADVFVVWDASGDDQEFTFNGEVRDSRSGKNIFSREFKAPMVQQRAILHQFVDEIALMLSGKSGTAHCKIAFVSDWTGHKELFTSDYDGHDLRQRTELKSIVLSPAYSPKGDKIAFISFKKNGPVLSILDAVSGRIDDILSSEGIVAAPSWSPDGRHIALSISKKGNCDIYLFDVATEQLERLTYMWSIETSPSFAPNCRSIAFTSDRTGRPQIYIMNIDGSGHRRLTYEGRHNESPAWSPDGSLIAYTSLQGNEFRLRLIGPDGDGPYSIVDKALDGEAPAWSPDGQKILFSSRNGGPHTELFLVNRDGTGLIKVVSLLGNCTEPTWSP